MNFYQHHIGDYSKDTVHLSMLEDSAYRRMLDVYYGTEKPLPKLQQSIYRLVRARTRAEQLAVDVVLGEFFTEGQDGWHNKRADEEIVKARSKSAKARESAHLSVEARRGKDTRTYRLAAARAQGTHTDEEWLQLVAACGGRCVRCGSDGPVQKDHVTPIYKGGSDALSNLQPLCLSCNTSKGPEAIDHVPLSVRSALVQRSLSVGSANQTPVTSNQTPEEQKLSAAPAAEVPDGTPDCPHERIISLYHELLPSCTRVEEWNDTRRAMMRSRWRDKAKPNGKTQGYTNIDGGMAYWRQFFEWVAESRFLTGQEDGRQGRPPFVASLEWLIRPTNFAKVVEGNYHR